MADATFMGLGGTQKSERGLVKGDLDVDQFTLMGTVGRHWTERWEALFTLSYIDLSTDLKLTTTVPVTGTVTVRTASEDASWVDPMLGFDYEDGQRGSLDYQHYGLTEQGPLIGVSYSF